MKQAISLALHGLVVWVAPFVVGMAIFAWVPPTSALFDTLMTIVLGAAASLAALSLWRSGSAPSLYTAARVGFVWMALAIALDAPFFLFGPEQMRMGVGDYFSDVGLGYALIPIICVAIARALSKSGDRR